MQTMRAVAIVSLLMLVLTGCFSEEAYRVIPGNYPSAPRNPDPSNPTIKNDPYSPTIEIKTDGGERGSHPLGVELYGLYAKIDRSSGKTTVYVQWSDVYTDRAWRFYSHASNNKAQRYDFATVDRSASSCSYGTCVYAETYNIFIPLADVKAGTQGGVSFKIFSQVGAERIIDLSADLLKDFVIKLDEAQKIRSGRT